MRQIIHWLAIVVLTCGIYFGLFYYNADFHYKTVPEQIVANGYDVEIHSGITTADGYILEIYRVKNRTHDDDAFRPAVLLVHGLLTSSHCFTTRNQSLAYVLTDSGYDVWLANARGTIYSRGHVNLSASDDERYWDYSWHEVGLHDIAATIDYVTNATGQSEIFYVGHSQGTTVYYVLASLRPEINARIKHMVALAPIVFVKAATNAMVRVGIYLHEYFATLLSIVGVHSISYTPHGIALMSEFLCNRTFTVPFCWLALLVNDYGMTEFEERTDANYVEYMTAILQGCSTKQFYHYAQMIGSDEFREYDYGKERNLIKYNAVEPPRYPLHLFNTTMSVYYSTMDHYVPDVERMKATFKNITKVKEFPFKHLDYINGIDRMRLYEEVVEDLRMNS